MVFSETVLRFFFGECDKKYGFFLGNLPKKGECYNFAKKLAKTACFFHQNIV